VQAPGSSGAEKATLVYGRGSCAICLVTIAKLCCRFLQ